MAPLPVDTQQLRLYKFCMDITPLERAVHLTGGQSALARKLNVKQAHVWNWLNRDRQVPAEHVLAIENATGGEVSRFDLRPDVFGAPPTGAA